MAAAWHVFIEKEKELLRTSWKTLGSDMTGLGVLVYEMIFKQCPEAKFLFPFMKYKTDGSEKKSDEFAFQALRFVQILQTGIDRLDDLHAMDAVLDNLGRRHGRLETSVGFKKHYWVVFRECAIYNIRKVLEKKKVMSRENVDDVIISWRFLLEGIIARIEHGYEKDLINRASSIDERGEPNCPRKMSASSGSTDSNAASLGSHRESSDLSTILSNLNPFKHKKSVGEKRAELQLE